MKTITVKGFPDYLINEFGEVFSIACRANRGRPKNPIKKSQWICRGYKAVSIQNNGKQKKAFVHHLMLESFVGERPDGYQCRHLDSNPLNNNLSNLKWGTRSENQMDRLLVGRDNRGSKHGMSKLTKEQVIQIKKLGLESNKSVRKIDSGGNYKNIAKMFNISPSTVGAIIKGRSWNWIK